MFTFMYTVRSQENAMRKRMCLSCAIALWKLFFQHLPDSFVSYLQRTRSEQEGIRQDEWNMFYSFMCLPPGSFDPNGPWPLLYCDYMAQLNAFPLFNKQTKRQRSYPPSPDHEYGHNRNHQRARR